MVAIVLLAVAGCVLAAGTSRAVARPETTSKASKSALTFAERVAYQRAIEEVYWHHRIWPKENTRPKPSLDEVVSAAQLEKRVDGYLRNSAALADFWKQPLNPEQLQAEMERMAQLSQEPEVLRELFHALDNDPLVIAECLVRPALAERLLGQRYAREERIHGALRQRAQAELERHPRVEEMKQLSGDYSEIELIRSEGGAAPENTVGSNHVRKLSADEWDQTLRTLAAIVGQPGASGNLSALEEDDLRFYVAAVIEKSAGRIKIATVSWLKQPVESWVAQMEGKTDDVMGATVRAYTLPPIFDRPDACNDAWTSTAIQPAGRRRHTTVWTGSEMIIWGGEIADAVFTNTGGRYTPSTDSWAATSTMGAPSNRADLTAVWTGTEMIVWGGDTPGIWFDSGGRYSPSADSWTPTSTSNAPHARQNQTAVWTGREMIVWGGLFYDPPTTPNYVNTGGRYNPNTDSWAATSTTNAPIGRDVHTTVWTGTQMIVWGGGITNSQWVNTGGKYNPTADSWTATTLTNAPLARSSHTAVWTGNEMIVWGGFTFPPVAFQTNTGGRYNPGTDSWVATSLMSPPSKRYNHTAVWTGHEMIVWGGSGCVDPADPSCQAMGYLGTGGRYDPSANSWLATSSTNAPSAREPGAAVWTGSEMIVWGGLFYSGGSNFLNTGGRYCAQPSAPMVQNAVSRKTHGSAGTFDVDLPLSGTPGVECRSGGATGDYTIAITFLANVSVNGTPQAAVTSGIGTIGSGGVSSGGTVITSGNVVTIPLTNVANAQTIQVTLNNVNGSTNLTVPMSVLIGDVDGNGAVNATDVAITKSRSGQPVSAATFRADVSADGSINATDVALVKSRAGTALP